MVVCGLAVLGVNDGLLKPVHVLNVHMSTPPNDDETTDELFDEAATELQQTLNTHLENTQEKLPDPDTLLDTDAENLLGALNTLAGTLSVDEALEEYRAARKQYVLGRKADAIDETEYDDTFEELEELFEKLDALQVDLDDITTSLPEAKTALDISEPETTDVSTPSRDEPAINTLDEEDESSSPDDESGAEPDSVDESPDEDGDEANESTTDDDADVEENEDDVPVHTPPSQN